MKIATGHQTVLLEEAIEALRISPRGIYIDATFGRGGHSRRILQNLGEHGRLYAFDKDPVAVEFAAEQYSGETRFHIYHESFTAIQRVMEELALTGRVDGVLFDLGVSSPQLDDPGRGFSFSEDGPLDMRMNT